MERIEVLAFIVAGASTRRDGRHVMAFTSPYPKLAGAMEARGALEARTGGQWEFLVVGLRPGESVEAALARTVFPAPPDARPWRLYAVEAFSYQPPGAGRAFWSWVWARSEEEAREDYLRKRRGLGRLEVRAVVELTLEQEKELGRMALEDWREAVEAYARKNMEA